jgi:hypothetical protein
MTNKIAKSSSLLAVLKAFEKHYWQERFRSHFAPSKASLILR